MVGVAFPYPSGHPRVRDRLQCFQRANPVVERTKIHVIHLQGNARILGVHRRYARDRTLAMYALLSETVVGRELYLDRHDLTDCRKREGYTIGAPSHQEPTSADVLSQHRAAHPERRRGDVTPELDLNSRALSPVYVSHFLEVNTGDFSARSTGHQYRKWATRGCCRRLSTIERYLGSRSPSPALQLRYYSWHVTRRGVPGVLR